MARAGTLLAIISLSGCGGFVNQQTAAVRSWDGGSSELSVSACPTSGSVKETEEALHRILIELTQAGVLVSANSGSAKVFIDLCGK
jgi:hypothetical protein